MSSLKGVLVGMCNPLLDISAAVEPELLEKYKLKSNDAILAEDAHMSLYDELVEKYKVQYIAGGATQNSMRVAQWMLGEPEACTFFGAVGKDAFAAQLRSVASAVGVKLAYMEVPDTPTGKCAVLLTDKNRSMVTHLGAAVKYSPDHLKAPEQWALIEQAKYFYVSGFFLTSSAESAFTVAEHAAATNKTFIMNLSAPFIPQFFTEPLMKLSQYWDVIVGNETEYGALAAALKWEETDLAEIVKKVVALPKLNAARPRLAILTHGAEPTLVASIAADGTVELRSFPTNQVPSEKVIDTNGAGDAFMGGFLSRLIKGAPLEECIRAANYSASVIIQRDGCTFPDTCDFE